MEETRQTTGPTSPTEPWVQPRSGTPFDLLNPKPEAVLAGDIVLGLAKETRYSGATLGDFGYGVAQHSVLVADILRVWGHDDRIQMEGLLHDAGEAYYGDWTQPVQMAMRAIWRSTIETAMAAAQATAEERFTAMQNRDAVLRIIETMALAIQATDPMREAKRRVDVVVREALGLAHQEPVIVKRADMVALAIERKHVMAPSERDWDLPEAADTRWDTLVPEEPMVAAYRFRERWALLSCTPQAIRTALQKLDFSRESIRAATRSS